MAEVRMHRDMGLNLIRVWGGGIAERPEFYDAADEMGVLVMQEFWMTVSDDDPLLLQPFLFECPPCTSYPFAHLCPSPCRAFAPLLCAAL